MQLLLLLMPCTCIAASEQHLQEAVVPVTATVVAHNAGNVGGNGRGADSLHQPRQPQVLQAGVSLHSLVYVCDVGLRAAQASTLCQARWPCGRWWVQKDATREWWGARASRDHSAFLARSGMAIRAAEVHRDSCRGGPYRVVLGVVNVHGRGVHVGLQRRVVIGEGGQFKGHGDGLGELQQHEFDRLRCPQLLRLVSCKRNHQNSWQILGAA